MSANASKGIVGNPAMKTRSLTLPLVWFTALTLFLGPARSQTVVTFDDLSENGSGAYFGYEYQGYEGLTWSNILCRNAILFTNVLPQYFPGAPANGLSGDYYGMVSPSNVAVLATGCEIDARGTNFNFLGAYLTGEWNSNLNVQLQGFRNGTLIYDTTVVVNATSPTRFAFDFNDIDRLCFDSYGGQPAFSGINAPGDTVMDNMTFDFIPEPSSLLLTALGAVTLCAVGVRRRRS